MRSHLHSQLLAIARREGGRQGAEDLVQEALLIAVEAGRHDLADPANAAWLRGVVRNRARMALRAARRRLARDSAWHDARQTPAREPEREPAGPAEILAGLPPALKILAALVLTGHNRREIAYLLDLPDSALRQRVSALKRILTARGLAAPEELSGLGLDLAYGRIRDALLPALRRHGGIFASHDPDGHLFIVRRSQKPEPRQ
ncbi:sigma factor [Devosia elaeis]|uniref:RNA polymerase sigma-70 region 2 domain-containing protein n=1 Tax=Devosia elaeis TaxID=1770058 RepID=A0A178I5K0_9HYPH|nr:sigma factor [Devosia elaeis]OAM80024.1 hypothetical protein A3840_02090 [Devosia elaeis]